MQADPDFAPRILGPLEIASVERRDNSAVLPRCRFKVGPLQQWDVRREFRRRLEHAFDSHGIDFPFPHLTLYAGRGKHGTAAPFRVQGLDGAA
jgi:small-conductance mechanosensitive channel